MITVTRLNGPAFALNPDLIERIESTPETVITLVDGAKYVVARERRRARGTGSRVEGRDHRPVASARASRRNGSGAAHRARPSSGRLSAPDRLRFPPAGRTREDPAMTEHAGRRRRRPHHGGAQRHLDSRAHRPRPVGRLGSPQDGRRRDLRDHVHRRRSPRRRPRAPRPDGGRGRDDAARVLRPHGRAAAARRSRAQGPDRRPRRRRHRRGRALPESRDVLRTVRRDRGAARHRVRRRLPACLQRLARRFLRATSRPACSAWPPCRSKTSRARAPRSSTRSLQACAACSCVRRRTSTSSR